jgi:hypothetical protein
MPKPPKPPKLTIIWEPVTEPNPEALRRAFAMMFRKRASAPEKSPGYPQGALTDSDEELQSHHKL